MNYRPINLFLILLLFGLTSSFTDPGLDWMKKVEPVLLNNEAKPFEALIWMKSHQSLDFEDLNLTKEEKGQYVFESLQKRSFEDQIKIIEWLEQNGISYVSLFIVNLVKVKISIPQLEVLAKRPDVRYILSNPVVKMDDLSSETDFRSLDSIEWGIQKIQADKVWEFGIKGDGVVVGGQDTGVEWVHSTLKEKYRGYQKETETVDHNYNWHDAISEISPLHQDTLITDTTNPCGLELIAPCDDHNHGTWTMGTMVGSDSTNNIGVAPDAKWMACRNMERGYGNPFSYLECFQWFLAPTDINNENADPLKAPDVINNSWSCPEMEGCTPETFQILNEAVDNLINAGIFVVVSAGNDGGDGCGSIRTPSSIFENSFTVGASNPSDNIAGFSSRGPVLVDNSKRMKPDIVAPGTQIRSARRNQGFQVSGGTSASGPHVAGTVALMISANPSLAGQVEKIKQILIETAIPIGVDSITCGAVEANLVPNNIFGHGRIDALAAVQSAIDLISDTEEVLVEKNEKFKIYPVPANHFIHLKNLSDTEIINWVVYDLNGRQVFSSINKIKKLEEVRFNIENIQSGVYIYQIYYKTSFQSGKLIKL